MRILLAEDNPADAVLLREAFEFAGVPATISVVEDGETLTRRLGLADIASDFDVAVLDASLPRRPSLEALRRTVAERGSLPLPTVVITTFVSAEQRTAYEAVGVAAVMAKPLEFDGYRDLVDRVQAVAVRALSARA